MKVGGISIEELEKLKTVPRSARSLPAGWKEDVRCLNKIKTGGNHIGRLKYFLSFAAGWTPCIGPILGAIVTLGLSTG
ncbi:cytochrome c biogenesis protein CcdA [Peribacillus frigoritolerans]|uniref:cytochrome c biogenesis protein CcdA n=1 Tax=Peribacillus frigoritolerans TaxID=450367 RepID=UPI0039A27A90